MYLDLILCAISFAAVSGVPGLFLSRRSAWSERLALVLMACAALAGLVGAAGGLGGSGGASIRFFPWPATGNGVVGLDSLSAFFLVPVFLMGGLGSVYGLGYWPQRRHPGNGRKLRLFWGLLTAGMALLIVSRHALSFLLGWEVMALSAFFLIEVEDHRKECRQASWFYLIATHVGSLALFALFALWRHVTGSYLLQSIGRDAIGLGMLNLFFILSLLGFGLKAGLMPLHFWLPSSHANAPSHVSAIFSGVVLKMGIYGWVRWLSLFPNPPVAWGGAILVLGTISALLGVAFAIGQHDLKRLLAYHSVENIGIILMGLGVALLGRSAGRPEWIVLGLAGCLLHVWNHSLFKALLFLCAGAVVHSTHTRQLDRLGGLAKTMPWTSALFLIGAVSICGLPPLNGFVSEWFVYMGLLKSALVPGNSGMMALIGVPALAMVGALAVACFVKVYGTVFLGTSRTRFARHASEVPLVMRLPMVVLAVCCALIGLAPALIAPILDTAVSCWTGETLPAIGSLLPLGAISGGALVLIACATGLALLLTRRTASRRAGLSWDCGYAKPGSRMQYTAGSFARGIVLLFSGVLRPQAKPPHLVSLFPEPSHMHSHVDEAVLDRLLLPAARRISDRLVWFHRFQRGLAQHYLLYILLALLALLSTLFSFKQLIISWFER